MSILTPKQIEQAIGKGPWKTTDDIPIGFMDVAFVDWCDTLAAYAEAVQAVAAKEYAHYYHDGWSGRDYWCCFYCGAKLQDGTVALPDKYRGVVHSPDCPFVKARKLRGM